MSAAVPVCGEPGSSEAYLPATDFASFHVEHAGKVVALFIGLTNR
jgi:hypothetical protein